jgi:Putative auto-transporter adhesin, head GIN domain
MKKIIFSSLFTCISLFTAAQDQLLVDPNATVRALKGNFNKIIVSGNIKVMLSQSMEVSLAVSALQEKYKEGLKTVIENNALKIYWDGGNNWNYRNRQLTAYLSFKDIQEIECSGASEIKLLGNMNSDQLKIELSGASKFKGIVTLNSFTLQLSGASQAKLEGKTSFLSIDCSGASDVDAYELLADTCNAGASGASDIRLNVGKELNAQASGASHIYYKGTATVANVEKSGVSKVSRKN